MRKLLIGLRTSIKVIALLVISSIIIFGIAMCVYKPIYSVSLNGEMIGLVCADMGVDTVTDQITKAVLRQTAGSLAVLLIGILIMVYLLKAIFLSRILRLEKDVEEYADKKEASLAETIRAAEQGNDEIRSLSDRFAGMITELDDYMINLQKVTAEKERIGAELNVATQIQADMLPRIFPPFPERKEFDLFASMDPAKEVGGDFYDFFLVDEDHIALVVADVSGKGVPAALFMVIAKTLIKNRTLMGGGPAEILTDVNNQLCADNGQMLFVTVWLGIVNTKTGEVDYCNAGHEFQVLLHEGKSSLLKEPSNDPPLALAENFPFTDKTMQLQNGDGLFIYTDGLPEAKDGQNNRYGIERMLQILDSCAPDETCEEIMHTMGRDLAAFMDNEDPFDDVTMLVIRLNAAEA